MFSSPNPLYLSHVLLLLVCSNPLLASFQFSAQDDLEIKASGSGRGTISVGLVSHHEVLSWRTSCMTTIPLVGGNRGSLLQDKIEISNTFSYHVGHYYLLETKLRTPQHLPLESW